MKHNKFFLFFLCMLLATSCIYADDELSDNSQSVQVDEPVSSDPAPVVVDLSNLVNQLTQKDEDEDSKKSDEPDEVIVLEPQLVSFEQTIQKVSASDTSGLKSILLSILGDYETVVTDYEYRTGNNTYTSHSISIERDYAWLCSCGVFALLLYCTFRSIGGILCRT